MKIVNRDDVLNAFCTPGGYIYVYTGLIKYLDQEDHLAGVLGHEIAHAENRHSSIRLQKEFGVKALTGFVLLTLPISTSDYINASILKELMGLSYSRDQEAQADEHSVRYLATSDYACDGTAVQREAKQLGCSIKPADPSRWEAFQQSLPKNAPANDDTTD